MKDHIKAIVIVFIILITYTILVFVYAKSKNPEKPEEPKKKEEQPKPEIKEKEDELSVVITPHTFLGYSDGAWHEVSDYNFDNKEFDVYTPDKYDGKKLVYTDSWYLVNPDKTFIDYDDGFVAIRSSIDYMYIPKVGNDLQEANHSIIKGFLDSKEIKYNYDMLRKSLLVYDLNHDGIKDEIYVVSDLFIDDYSGFDKSFVYVFARVLNQNVILYEDSYNGVDALSLCNQSLLGVIEVNDSPVLLTSCAYFSAGGTKHMLFSLNGKTATKILETKAN